MEDLEKNDNKVFPTAYDVEDQKKNDPSKGLN